MKCIEDVLGLLLVHDCSLFYCQHFRLCHYGIHVKGALVRRAQLKFSCADPDRETGGAPTLENLKAIGFLRKETEGANLDTVLICGKLLRVFFFSNTKLSFMS